MDAERGEHRRVFIKTVGVGVTGMLAGCLGDDTDTGGDDGDSTDGGADEDKPSNAEDNGTDPDGNGQGNGEGDGVPENGGENGNENATNPGGNGGEGDQPDELLEAARILDGENQELDSITLGEENDAVTSQNLTLETEGTGKAEYTAQIEYNGEKPGFAEELEQMLENTGEINIGEQINIGQLQYEQIKNQIQENTDANININIQQEETTEELSLDLEILENQLDVEKLKQVSQENMENAFNYMPEESTEYRPGLFRNFDAMRILLQHLGIEYEGHGTLEVYNSIDQMPEVNWSDASYIVASVSGGSTPAIDPFVFKPDIPGFEDEVTVNLPDIDPFNANVFSASGSNAVNLSYSEELKEFQKRFLRGEIPSRDDWLPLQSDYIENLDVVLEWNYGAALAGNEITHEAISSIIPDSDLHVYGVRIDDEGEPVFVENVLTYEDGSYVTKFDDRERDDVVNMMFPLVDGDRID